MMAALFFRHVVRCRSRQLYDALILPPTNHFVLGMGPSSTLSHLRNQVRLAAISPQKPAGSSFARFHIRLYSSSLLMLACALNSAAGGNSRVSCSTLVILSPLMVGSFAPCCGQRPGWKRTRESPRWHRRASLPNQSSSEFSRRLP